jgi:hypothetical protein
MTYPFKIWRIVLGITISLVLIGEALFSETAAQGKENVYMRLLAVNPSKEGNQTVSIKEYLPQEVTPKDIVSTGGLNLEYDTERGLYYVYKENIELPAGKTLTFTVELKDIWYIPEDKLNTLKAQSESILNSMKNTQQYSAVKQVSDEVDTQIEKIITSQKESEGLSFKQQVATYRDNLTILNRIQENIERMRNFWVTAGKGESGSSQRAMLEGSKLKSDIPSKTATWMVIFIIMTFVLVLGAAFFFAWIRSTRSIEKTTSEATESSFSATESEESQKEETQSKEPEEKQQVKEETENKGTEP